MRPDNLICIYVYVYVYIYIYAYAHACTCAVSVAFESNGECKRRTHVRTCTLQLMISFDSSYMHGRYV